MRLASACLLASLGVAAARADVPAAAEPPQPAATAPPAPAPPTGLRRWLDPATAPFIPIPEIDTDPYSGTTLGLIPTWLRTNERDEIERIIAPDFIHSEYFGWGSRMRIFGFPSADVQWSVVGGMKERVEREFDGQYVAGQTRSSGYSWSVEAIYDRSGVPRFFGIGNHSPFENQTTYLDNQARLDFQIGRNFNPHLQLAYLARVRYVDVLPGVLPMVPSIESRFPGLLGLGAEHELQQRLMLTYDTRDSVIIPDSGARYTLYGGFVSRALGSSVSYSYLGGEARQYWPLSRNVTLAWHAAARFMTSAGSAPFWALSSLGGDRSIPGECEPLRSEGADRFVDRDLLAAGAELRARVLGFDAFGTRVSLELAPFVDAGKVFSDSDSSLGAHLHRAIGLGVRGVASPYVVGYVDFGYGQGRGAVFSGIYYPF
ncbi:MAG TPA: BamA/TamA family outer membrane protein [Steroidobacteraceae bacterium]|nr:BamA/TamA family outer membrane protein [Steroidobacteraceae bacterium]